MGSGMIPGLEKPVDDLTEGGKFKSKRSASAKIQLDSQVLMQDRVLYEWYIPGKIVGIRPSSKSYFVEICI